MNSQLSQGSIASATQRARVSAGGGREGALCGAGLTGDDERVGVAQHVAVPATQARHQQQRARRVAPVQVARQRVQRQRRQRVPRAARRRLLQHALAARARPPHAPARAALRVRPVQPLLLCGPTATSSLSPSRHPRDRLVSRPTDLRSNLWRRRRTPAGWAAGRRRAPRPTC